MNSSPGPIPFAHSMLREHRHVCAIFSTPEKEYETLLPFICDGLNSGQRAFHVLPSKYREEHIQQLRHAGIEVEKAQQSRQLEVTIPQDTYLRGGRFSKDAMLALIQDILREGTALGFPLTRIVAHAESAMDGWTGSKEWVEYEMRLNDVLPRYDPVICVYDLNMLSGHLAVDILRTHPVAIIGGVLVENSFFSRPDDFLREVRERGASAPQPYRG
jgi:MEDS: MEthanogen/methylotroph, DcmR Sensory domain